MSTEPKPLSMIVRILAELERTGRAMGYTEIAKNLGSKRSSVSRAINEFRLTNRCPRLRIADYGEIETESGRGSPSPMFLVGPEEDAPKPKCDTGEVKRAAARRAKERYQAEKIAKELAVDSLTELDSLVDRKNRAIEARKAQADIDRNLARLRPLAGNVWGVCAVQLGAM